VFFYTYVFMPQLPLLASCTLISSSLGLRCGPQIGWFDLEENSSGVLVTKLVSDASYIRGAVGDTLGLMLQNLVTLGAGYGIAFA
jgi:hypothetical protein